MPEPDASLHRTPYGFPVQYPGANMPQTWAAGSGFMTMRAIMACCEWTRRCHRGCWDGP
ncbi:MAG TPA: hypothetical protein VGC15_17525 [Acetobacteraceae bacterium]